MEWLNAMMEWLNAMADQIQPVDVPYLRSAYFAFTTLISLIIAAAGVMIEAKED